MLGRHYGNESHDGSSTYGRDLLLFEHWTNQKVVVVPSSLATNEGWVGKVGSGHGQSTWKNF